MNHAALIASLLATGLGTIEPWPDTTARTLPTASIPDTVLTPSAGTASDRPVLPVAGTNAAIPLDVRPAVVGPRTLPAGFRRAAASGGDLGADAIALVDTTPPGARRPRAIEYSDWYYRRLTMHRIGSYVEFPLFAGEYVLGERLLHDERLGRPPSGLTTAHTVVAGGLGVLFAFNTVTGGWNLWESRKDPSGRTRRILHTVLMLAADAGFAATAAAGGGAKVRMSRPLSQSLSNAQTHRTLAEASMGIAAAGTLLMWLRRD
jgi:hypothetical protein